MKKLSKLLLSSVVCSSMAYGTSFEYPQIYKDQKTMGMGGASIATGGTASSLFSNPAGLSKIPKSYGWEVNLIDFNIAGNDNIADFITDLDDISDNLSDSQETQETLQVLENYLGDNLHFSTTLSSFNISKNFDKYAFSFMPIAGVYTNLTSHRGNGTDGLLEANGLAFAGIAFGVSRELEDFTYKKLQLTNINIGVGLKAISYQAFNHNLSVAEIVDNKDELIDYLIDDVSEEGDSVVLDLGIQAQAYKNFDIGLSVLNIGTIGNKDQIEIPMTVNVGAAYTILYKDRIYFDKIVFAADYIDLLQNYEQDEDFIKRTRLGVNAHLLDGRFGSISAQTGLYQGYVSYGFDVRLSVLKVAYSSYAEEVGPESSTYEDRRHMLSLSIGW